MKTETIVLNQKRSVTLTAYLQDVGGEFSNIVKRPAVLVLPGGGYQICSDREADPIALAYLQAGFHAFILRYSVGENAKWPAPLNDYEQAMELIRSKEDEWHLYPDKVAVIGFSAGGHLAAAAATMAEHRPAAAILGYALTGDDVKTYNSSAPNVIPYVNYETCPCFLFAARTDDVVPVRNTVKMVEALTNANISFESHIYAYGPHGFSLCDSALGGSDSHVCKRIPHWVSDSIEWLKEMLGDFGDGCLTNPKCKAHATGDGDSNLSVDCTVGYLMSHPEGGKILISILGDMLPQEGGNAMPTEMMPLLQNLTLRTLLGFMKLPKVNEEEIERCLAKIPNRKE